MGARVFVWGGWCGRACMHACMHVIYIKGERQDIIIIYSASFSTLARITVIYIYNSVLTCRQNIINSSASAPLNATKIDVKKVSDVHVCMFGPEL